MRSVLTTCLALLVGSGVCSAQTLKRLHTFTGGNDGAYPNGGVTRDASGNLFGTAVGGGANGNGTVYELESNGAGGYAFRLLYTFTGGHDGAGPFAGVTLDMNGNLFGTARDGGAHGAGTVYELESNGAGGYTFKLLHTFTGGHDGAHPYAGVTLDMNGNLFIVARNGGPATFGTVVELVSDGAGTYTFKRLHTFTGGHDGSYPYSGLAVDSSGNVFGTASGGGAYGHGTVFEMEPNGVGGYNFKRLHTFTGGNDGSSPDGGLTVDNLGNIYGTAFSGGADAHGTAFTLELNGGVYAFRRLHTFTGGNEGSYPYGGLTVGNLGNVYGTVSTDGADGHGTVFQLAPNGAGGHTFKHLHDFTGGIDGGSPSGSLAVDSNLNIFGTAKYGGSHISGTVFEITP